LLTEPDYMLRMGLRIGAALRADLLSV